MQAQLEDVRRSYALDKKKITQATADKDHASRAKDENNDKLMTILNENKELRDDVGDLKGDMQKMYEHMKELESVAITVQQERDDQIHEFEELEAEYAEMKNDFEEKSKETKRLEDELAVAEQEESDLHKRIQRLLEKQESELGAATSKLAAEKTITAQLRQQIQSLKDQTRVAELESQVHHHQHPVTIVSSPPFLHHCPFTIVTAIGIVLVTT